MMNASYLAAAAEYLDDCSNFAFTDLGDEAKSSRLAMANTAHQEIALKAMTVDGHANICQSQSIRHNNKSSAVIDW